MNNWAEAFAIFAKYEKSDAVSTEYEEITVGISPSVVSSEDVSRLKILGWDIDESREAFVIGTF